MGNITVKNHSKLLLLASASLIAAGSAAQAQEAPAADAPVETVETTSNADAELEFLKAQVEALQAQVEQLSTKVTKTEPSWKGAPQFGDADAGWTFKLRGRFMYDTAYIDSPFATAPNKNLGFNSRIRRLRLGVEGTLPGDFGYKFEADFANSTVGFGDVIMTYAPKGKPWQLTIGNFETMDGMEQITSSRFTSFIERAQMNDAFTNTRRLGIGLGLKNAANTLRYDVGFFTAHTIDASFDNDGWIAAARLTYAPQAFGGQLHFGASAQHREFQSNASGVASVSTNTPSTNQIARYRARPFLQTTGERFVDTGNFAAKSDNIFGLELAGIFGPLHVAGEAQYTKVKAYAPGDISTGLDAFAGGSLVVPNGDPSFYSYYAEVGYFLTGETRGYKNGLWDRTKVKNPFDKGGWGALQINARYDYLDLDSSKLKTAFTNNFGTGVFTTSNSLSRGGKQTGYLLGLTWIPMDYVRFIVQYVHTDVEGGPFAATAKPTSTKPIDQRSYGVDSLALRAQFDF
jgi:phosphate-selective porin OprO/OprP